MGLDLLFLVGVVKSIEEDQKFGTVQWELSNGGQKLSAPLPKPEVRTDRPDLI